MNETGNQSKLDAYRRRAEQHGANIKNFEVFTLKYVPQPPIDRPEMEQLMQSIADYEYSGIPNNVFVFGSRGCGKTLAVRFIKSQFDQAPGDSRLLYVSARDNNTSYKMLAQLLRASARGYCLSELFERFRKTYGKKTVLVIDEVDFMSEQDPGREILYLMSRAEESYMLILLANNPKFLSDIDPMTRSSLAPIPLHFKNYDATQIYAILRQRAEAGLRSYSDIMLRKIAAMVAQKTNSDVRVAIKTLYYAGRDGGVNIEESFASAQRDLMADVLCDLNYSNILVLKALMAADGRLVKDVYRQYLKLCSDKHEKPLGYTRWYHNLSYLQSIGLVLLVSTKVGKTYTNRIDPLFEEVLLHEAQAQRFHS